jgi:hypothetical protein
LLLLCNIVWNWVLWYLQNCSWEDRHTKPQEQKRQGIREQCWFSCIQSNP